MCFKCQFFSEKVKVNRTHTHTQTQAHQHSEGRSRREPRRSHQQQPRTQTEQSKRCVFWANNARTGFEIPRQLRERDRDKTEKQNGAQVRQIDNHCLNKILKKTY